VEQPVEPEWALEPGWLLEQEQVPMSGQVLKQAFQLFLPQ
tara:strand:+ start:158 stop:277 length:120 start_codon:yes stop_codon:yes gene_type:complete